MQCMLYTQKIEATKFLNINIQSNISRLFPIVYQFFLFLEDKLIESSLYETIFQI